MEDPINMNDLEIPPNSGNLYMMRDNYGSARHTNDWSSIAINKPCDVFKLFIGLVYGKITGIPPYLKVKTMVSCRFSLKPIQ